jgi:hypothetical protein
LSSGAQTSQKDAYADIHLSILGKKLQIRRLFNGYTALVSLIWNLPTKLTSIFNLNFLTNDQNEYVMLNNGMIVRVETLGATSFDLSGLSEVSFWSQYAKTQIKAK